MIAKTIGLKMSRDPRGKISAGRRNAEGRGEKLDYFNVSKYPEVMALYGEKPSALWVAVSSDDLNEVLRAPFEKWVGGDIRTGKQGTRQRVCDGETCIHRLDSVVGGEKYEAGTTTECVCLKHGLFDLDKDERKKQACQCDVAFTAHILHPETKNLITYHPVEFTTQSINSAKAVIGTLTALAHITSVELKIGRPVLRMIPMILTVRMVESSKDPKVKFPVWSMVIGVQRDQLIQGLLLQAPSRGWDGETVHNLQLMAGSNGIAQIVSAGTLPERILRDIKDAKDIKSLGLISDVISNKASVGELTELDVEALREAGKNRQAEITAQK